MHRPSGRTGRSPKASSIAASSSSPRRSARPTRRRTCGCGSAPDCAMSTTRSRRRAEGRVVLVGPPPKNADITAYRAQRRDRQAAVGAPYQGTQKADLCARRRAARRVRRVGVRQPPTADRAARRGAQAQEVAPRRRRAAVEGGRQGAGPPARRPARCLRRDAGGLERRGALRRHGAAVRRTRTTSSGTRRGLREEARPREDSRAESARLLASGKRVAICTHRPVLPAICEALGIEPEPARPRRVMVVIHRATEGRFRREAGPAVAPPRVVAGCGTGDKPPRRKRCTRPRPEQRARG